MTCQLPIQQTTALVPVPRFQIGEWVQTDNIFEQGEGLFKGVIVEQNYRINYDQMNWQYTIAITEAWVHGEKTIECSGDCAFDMDENTLTPAVNFS
ncbi:MAG: hypothetical protein V7K97_03935 [Nostoc sp.]|uniref:hypothetical protein n=1 Tax=Nostoc sp. TaxID=1180 RepID=UPI002FF72FD6